MYNDSSLSYIKGNAGFIIRKKQDPKSKFLNGPVNRSIRRRKLLTLFKTIL